MTKNTQFVAGYIKVVNAHLNLLAMAYQQSQVACTAILQGQVLPVSVNAFTHIPSPGKQVISIHFIAAVKGPPPI